MKEITTINGAWSDDDNGWVSEPIALTGDAWLEVELPQKGRIVIKKAEREEGPWPKALITKWSGPSFRIRLLHGTYTGKKGDGVGMQSRYIKIITTETPNTIQYVNI